MEVSVPAAEKRIVISCYNTGTTGAIVAGRGVRIVTCSVASQNRPSVAMCGTAAVVTGAFGVALNSAATGAVCDVCCLGPALMTSNGAIIVKQGLQLVGGTAGVRGRVALATATNTSAVWRGKLIGYALTAASAAARSVLVFVNPTQVAYK